MHVLVADLDEDAAALGQQLAGDGQAVTQVAQVGMDAELPGVAEGLDLLRLAGGILRLAVLDVPLAGADLPVGAELDTVGRVEVDRLDLALQSLLLGQAGHHQQRIAEDEAIAPLLLVLVEVDRAIERAGDGDREEVRLIRLLDALREEVVDERLGLDLLLDVDGDGEHGEVLPVLLVLAGPDELGIERGVARVANGPRGVLVLIDEIAQLLGRDVGTLVLVLDVVNGGHGGQTSVGTHCNASARCE